MSCNLCCNGTCSICIVSFNNLSSSARYLLKNLTWMQSSVSTIKNIQIKIKIRGLKNTVSSDIWFYCLALYSAARFSLALSEFNLGIHITKVFWAFSKIQRIRTFYTLFLYVWSFFEVRNCMLMILPISALSYPYNKLNMSWGYTLTYDWGYTLKVRSFIQMFGYIIFSINCCNFNRNWKFMSKYIYKIYLLFNQHTRLIQVF